MCLGLKLFPLTHSYQPAANKKIEELAAEILQVNKFGGTQTHNLALVNASVREDLEAVCTVVAPFSFKVGGASVKQFSYKMIDVRVHVNIHGSCDFCVVSVMCGGPEQLGRNILVTCGV